MISFVGSATATATYSVSSFDIALPSCLEDDIVVVVVAAASNVDKDVSVITSGYTEETELYVNDSVDANLSVSWKRMGPTPDTTVTCTSIQGNSGFSTLGIAYVIRGVDPTTALDVAIVTATGTGSKVPNAPSITPTSDGAFLVICGTGGGYSVESAVTVPTGFSNQAFTYSSSGYTTSLAVASKEWAGGGAEDPPVWTGWDTESSSSWAAATLAFKPAEVGPALAVEVPALSFESSQGGALVTGMPVFTPLITVAIEEIMDVLLPVPAPLFFATGANVTLAANIASFTFLGRTNQRATLAVNMTGVVSRLTTGAVLDTPWLDTTALFSGKVGRVGSLAAVLPEMAYDSSCGSRLSLSVEPFTVFALATVGTSSNLNIALPSPVADMQADVTTSSVLTAAIAPLQVQLSGKPETQASLTARLTPLAGLLMGHPGVTAEMVVASPALLAALTAATDVSSTLAVSLPTLTMSYGAIHPGRFASDEASILKWRRPQ